MIKEFLEGFNEGMEDAKYQRDFVQYLFDNYILEETDSDNCFIIGPKGFKFNEYCAKIANNQISDSDRIDAYEEIIENLPASKFIENGREMFINLTKQYDVPKYSDIPKELTFKGKALLAHFFLNNLISNTTA